MACVWLGSLALPRMELLTDAGKHAFDGGSAQATCSACEAVVYSLSLAIRQPFESVERLGSRERWEALNRQLFLQQVLDPSRCTSAMKYYDLAFVPGVGTRFVFGAAARRLPVQMELNEWVKGELARFCEAFIEDRPLKLPEIFAGACTRAVISGCVQVEAFGSVQGEVVDVDALFKNADQDGDGEVTLEEYKKFSVVPKLNSEDAKTEGFTQIAISHVLTVIEKMRKAILEYKQVCERIHIVLHYDWRKHVGFGEIALALGTAAALAIGFVVMRRR
ncbi:MAG: hypothetical protein SGPRY_006358 [Prymnesium sp.]